MGRQPVAERIELDSRQRDILLLIAAGEAYKTIAAKLQVSQATVAYHVGQMQQLMRAKSLPALIARSFVLGFLSVELLAAIGLDDLPLDGN